MSDRPTVAGALARAEEAHAKIVSHEEICAIRYDGINKTLGELRFVVWSVLFGLLAWMAVQLWNGQDRRIEKLEDKPATISTTVVK